MPSFFRRDCTLYVVISRNCRISCCSCSALMGHLCYQWCCRYIRCKHLDILCALILYLQFIELWPLIFTITALSFVITSLFLTCQPFKMSCNPRLAEPWAGHFGKNIVPLCSGFCLLMSTTPQWIHWCIHCICLDKIGHKFTNIYVVSLISILTLSRFQRLTKDGLFVIKISSVLFPLRILNRHQCPNKLLSK